MIVIAWLMSGRGHPTFECIRCPVRDCWGGSEGDGSNLRH